MIRINCTNCKAQLSIDDAFAGGVCRCQYCGTIQTVPKHLKSGDVGGSGMAAKAAGAGGASKTLYRNKARAVDGTPSSGLDAIADAVATSSGLSGSGLTSGQRRLRQPSADQAVKPPETPKNRTNQILIICAVAIVLLLGVIIGVLLRNNGSGAANGGGVQPAPGNTQASNVPVTPTPGGTAVTPAAAGTPTFLGQPIGESTVVFVIDHGDATRGTLEYLKLALMKSVRSLRKDQKFQIVFWKLDNEKDLTVLPKGPSLPTDANVKIVADGLENVFAFRTSDPRSALWRAFAAKPGAVVIVSGKPVGEEFAKTVLEARKDSTAKVHCFSLDTPASRVQMLEASKKTGGAYRDVPLAELQAIR